MRTFVAVKVSDEVREHLAEAQRLLQRELAGAVVSWQALERSHLTLRFLGEVAERDLPGCRLAVSEAARRSPPFGLATAGFGAFPTASRPSVLWLGVAGDLDELDRLQTGVFSGLEHLVPAGSNETFRPHLTLGRVKRLDREARESFADLLAAEPPPRVAWQVESVELMASDLNRRGARHLQLLSAPLRG